MYKAHGTHATVFAGKTEGTIEKRFLKDATYKRERDVYINLGDAPWLPKVHAFNDVSKSLDMEQFEMDIFSLVERNVGMSEPKARAVVKRMVEAVAALHERGMAHLDIKVENFLVNINPLRVVVADFDTATSDVRSKDVVGTVQFMAPEILECELYGYDFDTKRSDMWSLGLAIFIVMVGWPPLFSALLQPAHILGKKVLGCGLYYYIYTENWSLFWSVLEANHLSKESKAFLQRLLCIDPLRRLTASELLCHPWLAGDECVSF